MHWMSVKLPDNFQMREHSWPCRFHIICKSYLPLINSDRKIIVIVLICVRVISRWSTLTVLHFCTFYFVGIITGACGMESPTPTLLNFLFIFNYNKIFIISSIFPLFIVFVPISIRRGRDRMVVGFTTTCAISAYRLSPLKLWIQIPLMVRCTRYNIMW
jgi:hypothetical protein